MQRVRHLVRSLKAMSKSGKAALAAGAAKIRQAEQETASTRLSDKELTPARDVRQVLRERVKILPGHVGLELHDDTTLAECLQILDYTVQLHAHAQFLIGDTINFGFVKWGDKYRAAMEHTGRAYDTLRHYAETARRIHHSKRLAHLSFSHHAEIVRLPEELMDAQLDQLSKIDAHDLPTARELREQIKTLMPSRKRAEIVRRSDELTDVAEEDDSAAPVSEPEPGPKPNVATNTPQEDWQPDGLTEDRLIPAEAKIVRMIKAYADGRPEGRRKAFKRYICKGNIL
jgi:hypothetical protein